MKIEVGMQVRCMRDYPGHFTKGKEYVVSWVLDDFIGVVKDDRGKENGWCEKYFEAVSEGPIRTRREIVPGNYGMVRVDNHLTPGWVDIRLNAPGHTAEELREAAHLFNQLAEVLEENQ